MTMPTISMMQLPPPKSWEELELLVWDLFRHIWKDPYAKRHGRQGQRQQGVDIYGTPFGTNDVHGVQVKGKDVSFGHPVTEAELRAEVEKAKEFQPPLKHFVLVTSAPRDAQVQAVARAITQAHVSAGLFSVDIWGWADAQERLAESPQLLELHYPQMASLRERPRPAWYLRPGAPQFRMSPGIDPQQNTLLNTFDVEATIPPAELEAKWSGAGITMEWVKPMRQNKPGQYQMKSVRMQPAPPRDQVTFEVQFYLEDGEHGGRWRWPIQQHPKGHWQLEAHLGSGVWQPKPDDTWGPS